MHMIYFTTITEHTYLIRKCKYVVYSEAKDCGGEVPDSQGRCCVNVCNVNLWIDTLINSNKSLSILGCTNVTQSPIVQFSILFLSPIYSYNNSLILNFSGAGDTSSALTKTWDCAKEACSNSIFHDWNSCLIFFSMIVLTQMCLYCATWQWKTIYLIYCFYKSHETGSAPQTKMSLLLSRCAACLRIAKTWREAIASLSGCKSSIQSFQPNVSARGWQRSRDGGGMERSSRDEVWREERDERGKSQWRKSD